MAIQINGETKRIGLALSGGGFRATAFHLGVFQQLKAMGLLWKLDVLSCVSGGSIAGAFLAANWERDDALERLEEYLRSRSIAVYSFLGGIINPFFSRLDKLAQSYERDLFANTTLEQLNAGPRLYINATNLSTGNMFFFVTGENKGAEMGEHELGVVKADNFKLSMAVAASSAFPPVFPPLKLDKSQYPTSKVDYVTLTDGGVYDNLGVNPLFRERNNVDIALVSDAGKPFAINERPSKLGTGVLKASIGILMEQVRGLQFDRLALKSRVDNFQPLWFSIDSAEGESQKGDAVAASAIKTHLKKLSEDELAVLKRHSAALFKSRIETYMPELLKL